MDRALLQLIKISRTVGSDSSLIQGGGGNTSVKTEDGKGMYIKASGTALRDMSKRNGWRRLRLDSVLSIMKDESISRLGTQAREMEVVRHLLLACDDGLVGSSRPSVEAHLHAFLDKCVIHLHPSAVLAYACARNGRAELEKLFKSESCPPVWVRYADPGFMLGKKITKVVDAYEKKFGRKPGVLFLQKHGLLISAESPDAALELLRKVIGRCMGKLRQPKAVRTKPISRKVIAEARQFVGRVFYEATGQYATVSYFCDDAIVGFWQSRDAERMLRPGPLTPDELLYAGGPAMWVGSCDSQIIAIKLARQIRKGGKPSVAFLVKGVGLFVAGTKKIAPAVRDIVASSFFIRANASRLGGVLTLSKRERGFIEHWEPDAFRKKLASY
jgi:rhamnulokinase